ncbi:SWI SNF, matrix associated, actin dependent regulator of chromatin, sub d, member 1, partial [Coelomomyces lativittatus]
EYSPPKYAYDIEVEVDDLPKIHKLQSLLNQTTKNKEIRDLEDRISATLTTLNHHRLKREFLLTFSQDPVRFMEHFIASQARDLETMVNGVRANQDEIRNAAFYQQPWVKDAVVQYLTSKYRAS